MPTEPTPADRTSPSALDPVSSPSRSLRWLRARLRGPWRVTVAEGSMLPAIAPGDWLLVDPTTRHWPRPGTVVLFREPDGGDLAVKRVRARAGARVPFNGGYLLIGPREAWLEADASIETAAAAGHGPPIDSNRFGPVGEDLLVGRVWYRYGPLARIGRIPRPSTLRGTRSG